MLLLFFFSSRRRHTRCALVTGVQTCALPIYRNFVTRKLSTDDGLTGLGDATLNGRGLAVVAYLREHVVPLLVGRDAGRIEDTWQFRSEEGRGGKERVSTCSSRGSQ